MNSMSIQKCIKENSLEIKKIKDIYGPNLLIFNKEAYNFSVAWIKFNGDIKLLGHRILQQVKILGK